MCLLRMCYYNMVSSSNLPFDFASTLIYNLHLSGYFQGLIATNPYQKSFLAWQVNSVCKIISDTGPNETDLVWISGILQGILTLHSRYCVTPLRAKGSAFETIFSQLKHNSHGTLTSVSYGQARAQILTRRNVHGPHVHDEYRNAPLYIKTSELPALKGVRHNFF